MKVTESKRDWHPGSFTKNFSWGAPQNGLRELYNSIRVGFDNRSDDVERDIFIQRIEHLNRPFHIPANFFLFNEIRHGKSYLVADELVFQAIQFDHSSDFDNLALVAFFLSLAGTWKGAFTYQRWPALWAKFLIIEKVSGNNWSMTNINTDTIEEFIKKDQRYKGKTTRKVATNLNHMLQCVKLSSLSSKRVEQWWVSAIFLVLDRVIRDRKIDKLSTSDSELIKALSGSKFSSISGPRSLEKELAIPHIIELYKICGREMRFDDQTVDEITQTTLELVHRPNSQNPIGAVHPTNYRIRKYVPRMCALLVVYAGFTTFEIDEIEELDTKGFIQRKLEEALIKLKNFGIRPTMSVSELMRITRDK